MMQAEALALVLRLRVVLCSSSVCDLITSTENILGQFYMLFPVSDIYASISESLAARTLPRCLTHCLALIQQECRFAMAYTGTL